MMVLLSMGPLVNPRPYLSLLGIAATDRRDALWLLIVTGSAQGIGGIARSEVMLDFTDTTPGTAVDPSVHFV